MSGRMSAIDITLVFSRAIEIAPGQPAIADQCEITMSPQQCLAVYNAVKQTIDGYQSAFGALNIPEGNVASTLTASQISELLKETAVQSEAVRQAFAASVIADSASRMPTATSSTEPPPPSKRSRGAARKKEP